MKGNRIKLASLALIFLSGIFICLRPAYSAEEELVAVINGQELRGIHLERVMNEIMPMARQHGGVSPTAMQRNLDKGLKRLVEDELLYQEAVRIGIKPDRKALKKKYKEAIERVGGKDRFKEALKHYGIDRDEFKRIQAVPYYIKGLLEEKVEKHALVEDSEVRDYYDDNKASHFTVEKRRIRHILLRTDPGYPEGWGAVRKNADGLHARIKGGEDFAEVARQFSEGPNRESGGDLGGLVKSSLAPDLAEAAWALKPGAVSGVIQTIFGYHILKFDGEIEEAVVPFEDSKERIKSLLVSFKQEELKRALVNGLREKAEIKVYR